MKNPLTDPTLDDRLGFVGTAGSGKTYSAGTGVERLLDKGARCVICDPLDVWWGLRVNESGAGASRYSAVILGGQHGDLPINEHAGALIGETVAASAESFIVSLSTLGTKAAERRFMLAFLVALYRHTNGEPVHLIFDEADMWAPQSVRDKEGEALKLLGQMETIVRRGRVKGFIPWLITQRPAVLSKDVLSQVDGLIAFKLTASQDRDAIGAWIEGQADRQQGKEILASLPTMQRGRGVVWVPSRGILETATFPKKRTFDSSATPKRGEAKREATFKPLNVEALRSRLETVAKEQEANDPKKLQAELARLRKELARTPVDRSPKKPPADAGTARADKAARFAQERRIAALTRQLENAMKFIANVTAQDFIGKDGQVDQERLERAVRAAVEHASKGFEAKLEEQRKAFAKWRTEGQKLLKGIEALLADGEVTVAVNVRHSESFEVSGTAPRPPRVPAAPRQALQRPPAGQGGGDPSLPKGERATLIACAQHVDGATREQITQLSGYKRSTRDAYISRLREKGYLEPDEGQLEIRATQTGIAALGADYEPLPTGDALLQYWLGRLPEGERICLQVLAAHGTEWVDRSSLDAETTYKRSTRDAYLSRLAARRLVEPGSRGLVRASAALFD